MVSMEQGPQAAGSTRVWNNQSTAMRMINVIVIPLVVGAIAGAFLHLPIGYWVVSVLAAVGAFFAGAEHREVKPTALRGLVAGAVYGIGILVVYYSIRNNVSIEVAPAPSIGTPVVTGIVGALITALGARVLGQRTAH